MCCRSARIAHAVVLLVVGVIGFTPAGAQNVFDWDSSATGSQQWNVDGAWAPSGFPNGDMDVANISVGAALDVGLGASDITAAGLSLDGADVTISSGGSRLVLDNGDDNDFSDVNNPIVGFNNGRVNVTSGGGAGVSHEISAPVRDDNTGAYEGVDFYGDSDLTLSGGWETVGPVPGVDEAPQESTIRSFMSDGAKLLITGPVSLTDAVDPSISRSLNVNSYGANDPGQPPRGWIEISGNISGSGNLEVGWEQFVDDDTPNPSPLPTPPLSTVVLSGNNTFTGDFVLSRANVYLGSDTALGAGEVANGGQKQETGYNFFSTDDARVISNDMTLSENVVFKGEHSLTWSGIVLQTNVRDVINNIADGKELTFSGPHFAFTENDGDFERVLNYDGSGRTLLTAGFHDRYDTAGEDVDGDGIGPVPPGVSGPGSLRKRGSGVMVVSGESTYTGNAYVEQGNLHFVDNDALGDPNEIVSTGGAVGVDSGVIGNTAFLSLLTPEDTTPDPYSTDDGGLMLGVEEYDQDISFAAGGNLEQAGRMSLAAHESGSTYTGTITPRDATYRLGGGSGALTLPDANQLTGANSVRVVNGSEVVLPSTNNYTGGTTLMARFHTTAEVQAENDQNDLNDGDAIPDDQVLLGTTLTVSHLADGGQDSSIGSSSNDAENLFIQKSTLKYVGDGDSTDRLFTIGTAGATIDASGAGALVLTNTNAAGVDIAESRTADIDSGAFASSFDNEIINLESIDDLLPGMSFDAPGEDFLGNPLIQPNPSTIVRVNNPSNPTNADSDDPDYRTQITISGTIGAFALEEGLTVNFGPAPARMLTLTGESTAANALHPVVGDASDGGVVGITKSGAGTWNLAGENTYSGQTIVQAGVLQVTGSTGTGDTLVGPEGELQGDGMVAGALIVDGRVGAGLSTGTLQVDGDITLGEAGVLEIEIDGSSDFDLVEVAGAADLDGTLDVQLGFTPSVSDTFTVLTASSIANNLTLADGSPFDLGASTATELILTYTGGGGGLAGDFNNDGVVDARDYTVWRDGLGTTYTAVDYDDWRGNYGATSAARTPPTAAPEPAAVGLLVLGAAAGLRVGARRRGRRG